MKINPSTVFLGLFLPSIAPSTAQRGDRSWPVLMLSPSLLPGELLPAVPAHPWAGAGSLGRAALPSPCEEEQHTAPQSPQVRTRGLTYTAQSCAV